MKITGFSVEQQAQSAYVVEQQQAFIPDKGQSQGISGADSAALMGRDSVALSLTEASSKEVSGDFYHLSKEDEMKLKLIEHLISALTGKPFRFRQTHKTDEKFLKSEGAASSFSSFSSFTKTISIGISASQSVSGGNGEGGIKGTRVTTYYEAESMQFQSAGTVQTADGRTINFDLNLNMSREQYQKTVERGVLQDPLVLNFDGKGVAFGDDTLEIDLDLNGSKDVFNRLQSGSGFLALDKNGNGTVDDGSELFGATTGSGFEELSAYDDDGNGWIDESDAIFDALKVWTVSPEGEKTLIGLKEAGVGAIYLTGVASPYQLKSDQEWYGNIRSTGTYLKENGVAGTIQEIDLKL